MAERRNVQETKNITINVKIPDIPPMPDLGHFMENCGYSEPSWIAAQYQEALASWQLVSVKIAEQISVVLERAQEEEERPEEG